jgi:hypothetical protein
MQGSKPAFAILRTWLVLIESHKLTSCWVRSVGSSVDIKANNRSASARRDGAGTHFVRWDDLV